jgi:hypothetical protein
MPAFQNTYFTKTFVLTDGDGVAIDLTGWTLHAHIRSNLNASTILLDLTTANGGIVVTDAATGKLQMRLTAEQTGSLPVAKLVFDVLRTDQSPGPLYLFGGTLPIRKPVTRP